MKKRLWIVFNHASIAVFIFYTLRFLFFFALYL